MRELSIFERALEHIDQRRAELEARIADVQQELTWLDEERRKILDQAAEMAAAKAARDEAARTAVVDRPVAKIDRVQ